MVGGGGRDEASFRLFVVPFLLERLLEDSTPSRELFRVPPAEDDLTSEAESFAEDAEADDWRCSETMRR